MDELPDQLNELCDAGIVFDGDKPLLILSSLADGAPLELPDGESGRAAADHLIGRLARVTWDTLRSEGAAA